MWSQDVFISLKIVLILTNGADPDKIILSGSSPFDDLVSGLLVSSLTGLKELTRYIYFCFVCKH